MDIAMSRQEQLRGWIFWCVSIFVLSTLLNSANSLFPTPLSATELNLLYFSLSFAGAVLVFRKFLWKSLQEAVKIPLRCLLTVLIGYGVYRLAGILVGMGILRIYPEFYNVNDSTLSTLSQEHRVFMAIALILLVPVYEELFYRGLFFRGFYQKSPVVAYGISVCIFGLIHIMGYIGTYSPLLLLLCFVQYLPAGIVLALAYEKTDTIITPMLLHMTINLIGFLTMR